ncbi:unnamed protein product [Prorocentrum cordatum]|uniref:Sulfatase N-terminal domain-containing protein n=1 Tax=Prorocentrum cordatum TaxID=2364126 RepID=A0ABN9SPR8_9DINO|nr:unnamed protein product [Polarella glacialis]
MAAWGRRAFLLLVARSLAAASGAPEECTRRASATAEEDGGSHLPEVSMLQHTHGLSPPSSAGLDAAGASPASLRPNIVLFLPDDMYLSEYGPMGEDQSITPDFSSSLPIHSRPIPNSGMMPRLDAIMQTGAIFSRAYSTSSTCTPSRYSIMTGRYPSRSIFGHGFTKVRLGGAKSAFVGEGVTYFGPADMQKNVAQSLRSMGYTTGMVGKWGLNSEADNADYDTPYSDQTSLVQSAGFDFVDGLYIQNQNTCTAAICGQFSHNMEWITESALRFMDGAMKSQRPFFLYFAATLPHHPPESSDALLGLFNSSQTPAGVLRQAPDVSRYCSSCTMASREAIWDASAVSTNAERRHELAALRWVDVSLGVVYDFLSERAALDSTYLVISTDHGPVKGTLYEQGTRVPLYVVGPGITANTPVTDLVSHVDMAPTFLEWAGCKAESCPLIGSGSLLDGLSWAPLVSGKVPHLDRDAIYLEAMLDVAVVNQDSMKFLMRQTPEIETLLTDPSDITMVDDRIINLTSYSAAYPSYDESEQVYDLLGDSLEQVNLVSAIARAKLGGVGKYWDRIRAHEAKTFALTRGQEV